MSSAFIGGLILQLKEAEQRRLAKMTDRVVEKNMEVNPGAVMGFLHEGLSYRHSQAAPGRLIYGPLHESLFDEMDMHVASAKELDNNLQAIKQALLPIARLSTTEQELRDGLPECIVGLVGLKGLERTQEPAWMLETGSRNRQHYDEVLPHIEFYSAARMIY